ncbi:hypothetical protein MJO28_010765 [Puccinia striiformis f. sp. tritici]|uniref:Uncharacterized protein n=1 Tax=Puccinia striiformis f. sp. tritici TaxID=168172 RepID=A0ACC0E7K3_9BASI|nr:hypothetical protein MJO28_010765 [Puccinia striiformis f. sp. tritici]KAI7948848.1 hypothetical protein MJO29_010513 [Puccinia striiformis f. sp. tritici]
MYVCKKRDEEGVKRLQQETIQTDFTGGTIGLHNQRTKRTDERPSNSNSRAKKEFMQLCTIIWNRKIDYRVRVYSDDSKTIYKNVAQGKLVAERDDESGVHGVK